MDPSNQKQEQESPQPVTPSPTEETVDESAFAGEDRKRGSSNNDSSDGPSPSKKLRAEHESSAIGDSPSEVAVDVAHILGYKEGDRFEVQWDIAVEGSEEPLVHWWGAKLLAPAEGEPTRCEHGVVRVLEYEPFVEGGFEEISQERVVFKGTDVLIDVESGDELQYRPYGASGAENDEDDTIELQRDDIEPIVNQILSAALAKNAESWGKLSAAQQGTIAAAVAAKKSKLVALLRQQTGLVTQNNMREILAQTME